MISTFHIAYSEERFQHFQTSLICDHLFLLFFSCALSPNSLRALKPPVNTKQTEEKRKRRKIEIFQSLTCVHAVHLYLVSLSCLIYREIASNDFGHSYNLLAVY